MTDNKIIKALECCGSPYNRCFDCPLCEMERVKCFTELTANALDLINRQKAEIERWKDKVRAAFLINLNEEEKTEAVKFLFHRLIDISVCKDNGDGTESLYVSIPKARQLLNEMVGDTYV